MENHPSRDEKERLFEELVEIRIMYDSKIKKMKSFDLKPEEQKTIENELASLRKKIASIKSSVARYGESFLDVYDSELMKPLTEADIIELREEIREVRDWLESIKTP
jgi:hypothetical protein